MMCKQVKYLIFAGRMQVGKTTSAILCEELFLSRQIKVSRTAFADELKNICYHLFGIPWGFNDTNEDKNRLTNVLWDGFPLSVRKKYLITDLPRIGQMTRREVWQVWGSDIMREMVDEDIWARIPFRKHWGDKEVVIIDDLRYPNELKYARKNNAYVIKLVRNTCISNKHKSENALDNIDDDAFDLVIDNNGSLDYLKTILLDFLERYFK